MKMNVRYPLLVLAFLLATAFNSVNAQRQSAEYYDRVQLLSFEDLAYPGIARATRIQGIVIVKAHLDENGNVTATSALSGLQPLIADCLSNAKKWKFKPNSSRSTLIIYDFRLDDGACHDASHSLFRLIHPNFATITACSPVLS